ncbi:MAG: hypothetical protein ACI4BD_06755 [Paludibacteraceae bacterium]
MKTKIFLLSAATAMATLAFTACNETAGDPGSSQDRTIASSVVVATIAISNDFVSIGDMQLLRNGVVVKNFTANDTVCTLADTITAFPDSLIYVLDGKLDETKVDTTQKYRLSRRFEYTLTYYNAAGKKVKVEGDSASDSLSVKGGKIATYFSKNLPKTIGTVRVTNQ